MKKLTILSLLIIIFSYCKAQEWGELRKEVDHIHKGYFLSLSGGPNFSGISVEDMGGNVTKYNGMGPVLDLKIGRDIQENLIVHVTLTTNFVSDPEITSNVRSQNSSNNLLVGEDFIGLGITHYIMPSNIFLSGSIGAGRFRMMDIDAGTSGISDRGFGFQLKVGKEWWISKSLGMGVALYYGKINLTNTPSNSMKESIDSNNLGITLNTTLN